MTVKVYGREKGCVQCDATKRRLARDEIPFDFIDVNEDEKAFAYILGLGYQQVPVVEVTQRREGPGTAVYSAWSGYRPGHIEGLIGERKAA